MSVSAGMDLAFSASESKPQTRDVTKRIAQRVDEQGLEVVAMQMLHPATQPHAVHLVPESHVEAAFAHLQIAPGTRARPLLLVAPQATCASTFSGTIDRARLALVPPRQQVIPGAELAVSSCVQWHLTIPPSRRSRNRRGPGIRSARVREP
jgi:hypothetical protein